LDDCIEWDGELDHRNYGRKWVDGKIHRVHRLVWQEEHGPIPEGMLVLHRCDNPPCINIDHLFIGTNADNMKDMAAKGRGWQQKKLHCGVCGGKYKTRTTNRGPRRDCLPCERIAAKRYYYKNIGDVRAKNRERKRHAFWKKRGINPPPKLKHALKDHNLLARLDQEEEQNE
ncbi:MAG: HNH endonuclease signature motif containing protein, partial [Pyrinomonadaceae bacterium]